MITIILFISVGIQSYLLRACNWGIISYHVEGLAHGSIEYDHLIPLLGKSNEFTNLNSSARNDFPIRFPGIGRNVRSMSQSHRLHQCLSWCHIEVASAKREVDVDMELESRGVPLNHPYVCWGCYSRNHHFLGAPMTWETFVCAGR